MTWGSRGGGDSKVGRVCELRANVLTDEIDSDGVIEGEIETLRAIAVELH
jgi:hypothetical protein